MRGFSPLLILYVILGMILGVIWGLKIGPLTGPARAQEESPLRTVTIADRLDHPWALAFLPDGDFLVTERDGRLWRIGRANKKTEIKGLPDHILARRQGGLFDLALDPDFAENRLVYFTYNGRAQGGSGTELARARLDGDRLTDMEILFRAQPKMRSDVHFGGRIVITADHIYLTLGDRMNLQGAQDLSTHWGSIIRLHHDGRIPSDNPFINTANARPEIYAYGTRNAQGMVRVGDQIWFNEHGPQGGDEVNILIQGANYGWPLTTHGIDYDGSIISPHQEKEGITPPLLHWTPSIAPSGMAVYKGDKFPHWQGDIFVGALAGTHLRRLQRDGNTIKSQEILLSSLGERIRDVRTGPDGYLYILTDQPRGRLIRVEPAP